MEKCLFEDGINTVLLASGSIDFYKKILHNLDTYKSESEDEVIVYSADAEKSEHTSIFVKDRDYFRRVDFHEIRWIEASGSYCYLYLAKAKKIMLSYNLSELSLRLPSQFFLRVHRSYIVNVGYIDSFIGNMLCIGEGRIPVSKQHKKEVIARLNVLGNVK